VSKISVVLPLLLPDRLSVEMTRFCLACLYENAADKEFELMIVETGSRHFEEYGRGRYLHFPDKRTYVRDWNAGADAASGEFLVHIGNDVFVGDSWDKALLEPFERFKDCGVSTTSCVEPGAPPIGHEREVDLIVEGVFTPLMMFCKEWRFDEEYEGGYSDNDLIMRMYSQGLRSYRNYASVATHLRMVTFRKLPDKGAGQLLRGEDTFYRRWRGNPMHIYSMLRMGRVEYGREHLAAASPTPDMEPAEQRRQRVS